MNDSDSDGPAEQALAVDEGSCDDFDNNVPPTSGSEYLRRVRQEAQGCPRVVVANIDTRAFLQQQTVKVTEPSGLLPVPSSFRAPMAWQRLQVAEFAQLRQKLIQWKALARNKKIQVPEPSLPLATDAESWCRLCFGRMKTKSKPVSSASEEVIGVDDHENGTPPLLSIVAHMNQQQVENVLEYHINWLEATGFSSNQGRWLFALLANLQKPLTPEMCSWLRRLSRLCSNIRASLIKGFEAMLHKLGYLDSRRCPYCGAASQDAEHLVVHCPQTRITGGFHSVHECDKKFANWVATNEIKDSTDDPSLQELNLLICLVSRYFEQRDLADS